MGRWLARAAECIGWALAALGSAGLCLAIWRAAPPPDAPSPPPARPRPVTPAEAEAAAALEAELAAHLARWRDARGRWPTVEELTEALPDGLLPDNPAHPDIGGLEAGCVEGVPAEVDWRYCAETGRLSATLAGPAPQSP